MSQNWSKSGFDVITDITCNVGRCVPAGVIWIFPHGMWSSWFIEQLGEQGIHWTPDCRPGQPKVWNKNFKMAEFEIKSLSARIFRADCKFVPSQWETVFLCNDISHWLGASLESDLILLYPPYPKDRGMLWFYVKAARRPSPAARRPQWC